ncbi:MAG: hypothetical protein HQM12_07630 [SAR324 cluster bacterium]|nr:hypothetical protein [SAR324 cluster bacterium]
MNNETPAQLLREALKNKGIGPTGSKHLKPELLEQVLPLLGLPETNVVTAATFWTACLMLDNNAEEEVLLRPLKAHPDQYLTRELQSLTKPDLVAPESRSFAELTNIVIQKQNLTFDQASSAVSYLWHPEIPVWLKASFLQAERLKRETLVENVAFLQQMWNQSRSVDVQLPVLIDLCDAYDGTKRSYHLTPFFAAVLAAMGIPCVVHGLESVAPKHGITTARILKHAGKNPFRDLASVQASICDSQTGWGYCDQSVFFPELHALLPMRHDMVKRPFLATFEKLLSPVRNQGGNIQITGYVHPHYRIEMVKALALHNRQRMFFNLRSIEGSTNCWIKKATPYVGYQLSDQVKIPHGLKGTPTPLMLDADWTTLLHSQQSQPLEGTLAPETFGVFREDQEVLKDITLEQTVDAGIAALKGESGLVRDLLIYHAAMYAWLGGCEDSPASATDHARTVLQSGKALDHWKAQN